MIQYKISIWINAKKPYNWYRDLWNNIFAFCTVKKKNMFLIILLLLYTKPDNLSQYAKLDIDAIGI